jgi:endonuclease/exonuclease/phosphatase family metal-dependent hydrolase
MTRRVCALAVVLVMGIVSRASASDVVLYATDATAVHGNWSATTAAGCPLGTEMTSADRGWSSANAVPAAPTDYFEATFTATANTPYHLWLRLRATADSKWNDSVYVQFNDSTDTNGSAVYRIGTTNGLLVNLENCSGCGVSGWGWQDGAWWTGQSSIVKFPTTGTHTIRVQTREDGAQVDQIVLSDAKYLSAAPGGVKNDATIVAKTSSTTSTSTTSTTSTSIAYSGTPAPIPGTIQAENFDKGASGVSYKDSTSGNAGGQYRSTDVDIEATAGGGYDIAWIATGEWLNYTVNVAAAGSYTAQLRVASPSGGGSLHIGFNGPSKVWTSVSIPATGGWQTWSTVNVPMTLGAGTQLMTLAFDAGGFNLDSINVVSGSVSSPPPPPPPPPTSTSLGKLRMLTWNIHSGTNASNVYTLPSQVQLMVAQNVDVIVLQEVSVWNEDQPTKIRNLLQQYTGQTWYSVWAPSTGCLTTGCIGEEILTRIPIAASSTTYLAPSSAGRALIYVNGLPINIMVTHLDYYNTSLRTQQLLGFMSWAHNFGGPRLVGGDFNSWWGEYWIGQMCTEYSDTWVDYSGNKDGAYTTGNVRFDYIFRSFEGGWHLTPTSAYVVSTSLSDHRPFVAEFKLQ